MTRTSGLAVVQYEGVQLLQDERGQKLSHTLTLAQDFERQHKVVLLTVRDVIEVALQSGDEDLIDFSRHNFMPSDYVDDRGKTQPCYLLTDLAYQVVAMGFTGAKALKWKIKYAHAFKFAVAQAMQGGEFIARRTAQMCGDLFREEADRIISEITEHDSRDSDRHDGTRQHVTDETYGVCNAIQPQVSEAVSALKEHVRAEIDSSDAYISSELQGAQLKVRADLKPITDAILGTNDAAPALKLKTRGVTLGVRDYRTADLFA